MEMHPFYQFLDPYLIWSYRLTGSAGWNFVIGTLALVGITLLLGEATLFLVFKFIRKRLSAKTAEAEDYNDLAINALKAGNKEAYQAANKMAKEAFGHSFFQHLTLSAAFLWPVCFALAWMQYRFFDVEFPLPFVSASLGYIGVFILLYLGVYLSLKRLKKVLLHFRHRESVDNYQTHTGVLAPDLPRSAASEGP